MADPTLSLCVHRKTGSSGMAAHCEAQHCISQHWDFNALTSQQLVDTSFPHGRGGSPMSNVSTQCSEGSTSYTHSVVHGCIQHRLGRTLECIDGVQCMDNNRETTSCVSRQLNRNVLHQQAGRNTVNIVVQTDQEATPHMSGQPDSAPGKTHPQ